MYKGELMICKRMLIALGFLFGISCLCAMDKDKQKEVDPCAPVETVDYIRVGSGSNEDILWLRENTIVGRKRDEFVQANTYVCRVYLPALFKKPAAKCARLAEENPVGMRPAPLCAFFADRMPIGALPPDQLAAFARELKTTAYINQMRQGDTLLHFAMKMRPIEQAIILVKAILSNPAFKHINKKNEDEMTALELINYPLTHSGFCRLTSEQISCCQKIRNMITDYSARKTQEETAQRNADMLLCAAAQL